MFQGEPSSDVKERWQWTYPIIFSPVDSNVLYTSSQHVWKTTSGGQNWTKISPDLTRHDPKTMGPSGGPITHDMNSPEIYAVVFALGPGKKNVNVIWAGSDDGLMHVTRNGGQTWTNVTPKDMPDFGRVSIIDASAFDAGTAYAAVKRPLLGDQAPYLFRTHDFGKSWTKIIAGLNENDPVVIGMSSGATAQAQNGVVNPFQPQVPGGFRPGLYEAIYQAEGSPVAGLGLAVVDTERGLKLLEIFDGRAKVTRSFE